MRFTNEYSGSGIKVAHPDLRRISRFRSPDESFAVRRKPRALLVIRSWIQSPRFAAVRWHDPQMRNLCVRIEIHIFAIEHDPFTIRRRHRRADAFEFHHVFEHEGMFRRLLRERAANEYEKRDERLESHIVK